MSIKNDNLLKNQINNMQKASEDMSLTISRIDCEVQDLKINKVNKETIIQLKEQMNETKTNKFKNN